MKTAEKIWRTVNFKISNIDEKTRTFEAVASDDSTDRHGENIKQDGWDIENFIKNPVVPWGHDYYNPPVAKAIEIGVKDNKLMFKPQFATAEEYGFADTIFKLYKGGYLRAFSVGFIPKEMDGDTFVKQELLEISAVTVPSNPNALALAYKEGVIDDSERKYLLGAYKKQIESLTKAINIKDNSSMEEVKQLLEEAVTELKEAQAEALKQLEEKIDQKLADTVTDLEQKFVSKDATDDDNSTDDDTKDEDADPADSEDNSEGADEDADNDEGQDDDKELSDEEAEKMFGSLVKEAEDKLSGKVD